MVGRSSGYNGSRTLPADSDIKRLEFIRMAYGRRERIAVPTRTIGDDRSEGTAARAPERHPSASQVGDCSRRAEAILHSGQAAPED